MSDTAQIIGTIFMILLMLLALYGIQVKKEFGKPLWCMVAALILGVMLF
jgi:hypothetical protein